jgi:hypothetical protein
MAEATADFFVSYTSADRAWAEWIAWQLQEEGYTLVIQAWDFVPGHDWVHEMQQAASLAERVVVVLSAAYLKSGPGEAAWQTFRAMDPSGKLGQLLPVWIDKVESPKLLKTRVYVDLVGKDAASSRSALLAAARGSSKSPAAAPEYPGGGQQLAASVVPARPFPEDSTSRFTKTGGIFISYRRKQASGVAGRLYDRLADRFGEAQVFMDVASIGPGVDFTDVITRAVAACDVLLAVIGPGWLAVQDEAGQRRLDDPDDLVRLEIEAGLARDVRVIPVLVEGAAMPRRKDLPEDVATLARRNAFLLHHETFRADTVRLGDAIEPILSVKRSHK